eukprot:TRINITY_DN3016_c0_g2_i5.p1 TRINITY_DN3016_c0_g2~~TRINITY_DN3016_c0_g2_i5.p1  ORF type:complete len:713 (-),score=106.34 TRINITY_DN3016_c0_g2_i5:678-2546(-)
MAISEREQFYNAFNQHPPSYYSDNPKDIPKGLNCHRNSQHEMHTTLSNSILGQLYTDLNEIIPSKPDCIAARELAFIFSKSEVPLNENLNTWSTKHRIPMARLAIDSGQTDGLNVLSIGNIYALLVNKEDERTGCNADIQNSMYYARFWSSMADKEMVSLTVCPGILMNITRSNCTISGCVFTNKGVNVDHYFSTTLLWIPDDEEHRFRIARMIASIRKATSELQHYYQNLVQEEAIDGFPYYRTFDKEKIAYKYPCGNGRVYHATISGNKRVAVKFTKKYSLEAHQVLAEKGFAPQILWSETIKGGWKVIVMDWIEGRTMIDVPPQIETIHKLRTAIEHLHSQDFVHGDLRGNNIVVDHEGTPFVIDFDWAGKESKAKYPLFMNHEEIQWPHGATDGDSITKVHDQEMLEKLSLNSQVRSFSTSKVNPAKPEQLWEVYGLKRKTIVGDGNCLYRCIAFEIHKDHITCRKEVVQKMIDSQGIFNYIESDSEETSQLFEVLTEQSFEKTLMETGKVGQPGGQLILYLLSEIYSLNMFIYRGGNTVNRIGKYHHDRKNVHLLYLPSETDDNGHYDLLVHNEDDMKRGEKIGKDKTEKQIEKMLSDWKKNHPDPPPQFLFSSSFF